MTPRKITLSVLSLLCVLLAATSPAAAADVKIQVTPDRDDALYSRGETIRFSITVLSDGQPMAGESVTYLVSKDGIGSLATGELTTAAEPVTVEASLDEPGFVRCQVQWVDAQGKKHVGLSGAGVDPTQIPPSMPVPDDFDAFWAKQRELVEAEPMNPELTEVASPTEGLVAYDVQASCPGGAPLSGYFAKPKDAKPKSLPAVLWAHGAGVRSSSLSGAARLASYGAIAMDFNAHGLPNGKPAEFYNDLKQNELRGYPTFDREDPDKIYFRGMFLRVMRAIQFITAQPEWDGRTLIVAGSSQGGGQAIVAGGLDPRVTLVIANVPAICDHTGFKMDRAIGWPRLVSRDSDGHYSTKGTEVARYFDAMNFATRIKGHVLMTVGFIDLTCPATSVYAAFNNVRSSKQMIHRPAMGHALPAELMNIFNATIKEHIAAQAQTP